MRLEGSFRNVLSAILVRIVWNERPDDARRGCGARGSGVRIRQEMENRRTHCVRRAGVALRAPRAGN